MDNLSTKYVDLLENITKIQNKALNLGHDTINDVFSLVLQTLLNATDSEYGFVGEVLKTDTGLPYLKTRAISNIAWDKATEEYFQKYKDSGLEFHNLKTLFGKTLLTGKPIISNDPINDPRGSGIPNGHPDLNKYMGVPIELNGTMIGMCGIANRKEGYDEELLEFLTPLIQACAVLLHTYSFKKQERSRFFYDLNNMLDEELQIVRRRRFA